MAASSAQDSTDREANAAEIRVQFRDPAYIFWTREGVEWALVVPPSFPLNQLSIQSITKDSAYEEQRYQLAYHLDPMTLTDKDEIALRSLQFINHLGVYDPPVRRSHVIAAVLRWYAGSERCGHSGPLRCQILTPRLRALFCVMTTYCLDLTNMQDENVNESRNAQMQANLDWMLQMLSNNHGWVCFAGIFYLCKISIEEAFDSGTRLSFTKNGLGTLFAQLKSFLINIGDQWMFEVIQGRIEWLMGEMKRFMGLLLLLKPAY